jgi:pimeloyl-ACP methyl ester carboxylesterase
VIVYRIKKALRLLLPAALLAAGLGPVAAGPALASIPASPAGGTRQFTGTFPDGATYLIEVPAKWNGTLFLYSHGYVVPGTSNPAKDVGDPLTGGWLLGHGFALAGSSYAQTGWALQSALPDQIRTLNTFGKLVGTPQQTIAWGHSLGGMITAGLIQRYPHRFAAALPMCGVLSGGVATWNTALDSAFAFQQLLDPSISVVNITNPGANLVSAENAAAAAQKTAQGRARLALTSALGDTPGWFTPLSPEPAATAYWAQEKNQYLWGTQVTFPFAFALRADLEARAGGNPSWNTGVNYAADLLKSADLREVVALYHAAGLSLSRDIAKLNAAKRIAANPASRRYLVNNISYNGKIGIPVLTMHTIGDGLVVPENEQAYRAAVAAQGGSSLLRQIFVARAGHCAFTPAETITAVKALLQRLGTGQWGSGLFSATTLNKRAAGLGPNYNVFSSNGGLVATPPAFQNYSPPPYLRPFNLP